MALFNRPLFSRANELKQENLEALEAQLEQQQKELQEKLAAIKAEKERIERERLLRQPTTITVYAVKNGHVELRVLPEPFKPHIESIVLRYQTRANNPVFIKLQDWEQFCTLVYKEEPALDLKDPNDLVKFINAPAWIIRRHTRSILVKPNPVTNATGYYVGLNNEEKKLYFYDIPGREWNGNAKGYLIPLSEGWRLYALTEGLPSKVVKWEGDELIKEVIDEFNKRARLKDIHSAKDSTYDVEFPGDPNFKTRAHQRVALEFIDLVGGRALVAYGMGTGKTAISIGRALATGAQKVVVVVPGSLKKNWERHIKNLTGEHPFVMKGRVPDEYDVRNLMIKKPRWVIINYEILRSYNDVEIESGATQKRNLWVELLNMYEPDLIIVDEAHYMKNPSSAQSKAIRSLQAKDMLALTGTPVLNRPGELWPVLNWMRPEMFPAYETFLRQYGAGRSVYNTEKLRSLLESVMIRRTKDDVWENLPSINRITHAHELSDRAKKLYTKILTGIYEEMAEYDAQGLGGDVRRVKNILAKIILMKKVCAADKVETTADLATEIVDEGEGEKYNKVLIFSQFKGAAFSIHQRLADQGSLCFVSRTRDGFKTANDVERDRLVQQFQEDPRIKYLVVTEKTAKEGHDITQAGTVIFNDLFWTPAAHQQGEARAFHRMIDPHGGNVYYIQAVDTIEDWIVELLGIKQNTIDAIVEGKGIDYSIQDELMERLKESFNKWKEGK